MNNHEKIDGMRKFLNFAEETGLDFAIPSTIYRACGSAEEFSAAVKKLGSFTKDSDDYSLNAKKSFPGGLTLEVYVPKSQTCKRVVIGKKTVPFKEAQVIPAVPAHEEDIVKWECPESFMNIKEREMEAAGV